MKIEQKLFVGIQDVGLNNKITDKALLEALTNVTILHGNLVNQGLKDRKNNHYEWIVLNWKLEVYNRPESCDTIRVKTWAQNFTKIYAYRDYLVYNENDEVVAKATSTWLIIDSESKKIIKLDDDIMQVYQPEKENLNFPDYKFGKIEEKNLTLIAKKNFIINKSMIDCNNHVHNTNYMDLVLEVLPDPLDKKLYNNLEISYKREIKPFENVTINFYIQNNKNYFIIKDEEEKIVHSIIILY